MTKKIFQPFALCMLVMFGLSSCKQDVENKLQGTWNVVHVPDVNSPYTETWEFTNDGKVIVKNDNPTYGDHDGKYTVEATFLETRLKITDFPNQYNFYNADWWIVDLKAKKLYIVQDKEGGLFNKEFER